MKNKLHKITVYYGKNTNEIKSEAYFYFKIYPSVQVQKVQYSVRGEKNVDTIGLDEDFKETINLYIKKWLFKQIPSPVANSEAHYAAGDDELDFLAWECTEFDDKDKKQIKRIYIMEDL